MNLPRGYISYNQISTYQNCPQKYYFYYIKEIEMPLNEKTFLGIVFHSTLEHYFTQRVKGIETEKDELIGVFEEKFDLMRSEKDIIWGKTPDEPKRRGRAFVSYFLKHLASEINPLMVEKKLEIELTDIRVNLKGIIDLVEQDFSITDFKTTNSKWSKSRLNRSFLQMIIYKYLFEKSFGEVNSKLKLQILYSGNSHKVNHQEIFLKPEDINIDKMFNIIHYVVENIKSEIFYKNESYICGFCDFREICHPKK
jgi:DNA helicase-2/ATP-dependent DNA helicase PcrA